MKSMDTVRLLRECDAGTKMAVASIDEILEDVSDSQMKHLLSESKEHHDRLERDISLLLDRYDAEEKNPGPMAKSMSWVKTNMKMTMDYSDATVADLITDGCDMGVKSLNRYKNQYKAADFEAKEICNRLISIEEKLGKAMQPYL